MLRKSRKSLIKKYTHETEIIIIRTKEDNGIRRCIRKRCFPLFHNPFAGSGNHNHKRVNTSWLCYEGSKGELKCTVKLADGSKTFFSQTTAAIFISQWTSGFQLYLEVKYLL